MKSQYIGNPISKDYLNRMVSGVCAGIAKHFSVPAWLVRTATVIFGLSFPMAAVFGYFLAVVLMPNRKY